jgi:GNAT superfamily N-acetyltransferase
MAIAVRPVRSAGDYAAWRQVRMAVVPYERTDSVEALRVQAGPQREFLLAEMDGVLAGSGLVGKSDLAGAGAVAARVLPDMRRLGIGTEILRVLAGRAAAMGFDVVNCHADDPGAVRFAERYGFREVYREVEQARVIGDEPAPRLPQGVVILPVSERPGIWRAAYEAVGVQAFQDMATPAPLDISVEQWERDWITDPEAMFVALAGEEVIGCAGLLPDTDDPERAEQALTVVRRDWRRRGVAAALKRATLAWAAVHGLREVYTWTQRGNEDMRALNEHLGFVTRRESISMRASLPLTGLPPDGV